jgi:1,4-dihydroxy-2-naphthoyl-CoA hydrolase
MTNALDIASLRTLLAPLFPGLMGLEISEASPERIVAAMRVRPDLCTTGDSLHGGALMAFADTLGGVGTFVNLPPGKRTTTIESSTKFIGAAKVGSVVTGECTALHRGRTTMVWQTRITSDAGKLCGVVIQTQLVLDA